MLEFFRKVYGLEEKQEKMNSRGDTMDVPYIFGSVTGWNLHQMLGGQIFVMLLMYYLLKKKLKELGRDTDKVYSQEQNGGN